LHGYVFPDHAEFALDATNANGAVYPLHIGIPSPDAFASINLPAKYRNGRIFFCKCGGSVAAHKQRWDNCSEPLGRTSHKGALQVEHEPINSKFFPQLIRKFGASEELIIAENSALMMYLHRELDEFERGRRSEMIVNSLIDYPIEVIGRGWDHINFGSNSRWISKGISYQEVVNLMPHYLGILNTIPLVDESVHDRVFFGLGCVTAILTDRNTFALNNLDKLSEHHFDYQISLIQSAANNLLLASDRAIDITIETRKFLFDDYSMSQTARVMSEICSKEIVSLNK